MTLNIYPWGCIRRFYLYIYIKEGVLVEAKWEFGENTYREKKQGDFQGHS